MNTYMTIHKLQFLGPLDDFDTRTDRLYEALWELHGVSDPDMAANMSEGTAEVTMILQAKGLDEAVTRSTASLRSAIHAIGGSTAGWDKIIKELSHAGHALAEA